MRLTETPKPKRNTRDEILSAAIELFAESGYYETPIRAVARAVGIKESSLYRHFTNKQQILDEILAEFDKRFWGGTEAFTISGMLDAMSPLEVLSSGIEFFTQRMRRPGMVSVWRIMAMEQYRNAAARAVMKNVLIERVLDFLRRLFTEMLARHLIRPFDPALLAEEYQNPLFHLMNEYCLGMISGEETADIERRMEAHARFFWALIETDGPDAEAAQGHTTKGD